MSELQKKRNIIFVPGIATLKWMSREWKKELESHFPNDDIFIIDKFYFYTQKPKLHELVNDILEVLKNQQESILIGHSFGGIIAVVAYLENKKLGRNNIKKIITLASPHSMKAFHLREIKEHLSYNHADLKEVELTTYGAFFDSMVPNKYTRIISKTFKTIFCSHNSFLFNKRIIRKIIKQI